MYKLLLNMISIWPIIAQCITLVKTPLYYAQDNEFMTAKTIVIFQTAMVMHRIIYKLVQHCRMHYATVNDITGYVLHYYCAMFALVGIIHHCTLLAVFYYCVQVLSTVRGSPGHFVLFRGL